MSMRTAVSEFVPSVSPVSPTFPLLNSTHFVRTCHQHMLHRKLPSETNDGTNFEFTSNRPRVLELETSQDWRISVENIDHDAAELCQTVAS